MDFIITDFNNRGKPARQCVTNSSQFSLFAGFKVVNGADDLYNFGCGPYVRRDVLHAFISHGAFVQRGFSHGRAVDVFHLLFKLRDRKRLLGRRPAHKPSRAVGRGLVPVVVSLPDAD